MKAITAPTRDLSKLSNVEELAGFVEFWSTGYDASADYEVLSIAGRSPQFLTSDDLRKVFAWKLQPNHLVRAQQAIAEFVVVNPGRIEAQTMKAAAAGSDEEALFALRGLPQMKSPGTVAVASCLLMVLDPDRWTVIDRRANETLVALGSVFAGRFDPSDPLSTLAKLLDAYRPPKDFSAVASDFPQYLRICREISQLTGRSLRDVDRALYLSLGNLGWCSEILSSGRSDDAY